MIPDFKTYLKESIWTDIQKRSTGEEVREEDNIDHLAFQDFCEYVKEHYKIVRPEKEWVEIEWTITDFGNKEYIRLNVPLERVRYEGFTYTYDLYIYYSIADRKIEFMKMPYKYFFRDYPEAKTILEKDYVVDENTKMTIKSGEIKNHNVIKTIDDLLTFPKNPFIQKINESIWSDIQDRSDGTVTRKEDDINGLDFEEFVKYLQDRYKVVIDPDFFGIGKWYIGNSTDGVGVISIPIEKNDSKETPNMSNRMLQIKKDLMYDEFSIIPNTYVFRLYPNELRKAFEDEYEIRLSPGADGKIILKNGEITNQVCVDVLDRLLDMVERPILVKKS